MYQLTQDENLILNTATGQTIPKGGADWREYQAWIDAGNTPEPYVAPTPTAEQIADQGKIDGFLYGETQVPVTNADAIGAMQIKMGFEDFGMQTTNFHLSNGEVLTLILAEWPAFAAEFFAKRASFF